MDDVREAPLMTPWTRHYRIGTTWLRSEYCADSMTGYCDDCGDEIFKILAAAVRERKSEELTAVEFRYMVKATSEHLCRRPATVN